MILGAFNLTGAAGEKLRSLTSTEPPVTRSRALVGTTLRGWHEPQDDLSHGCRAQYYTLAPCEESINMS